MSETHEPPKGGRPSSAEPTGPVESAAPVTATIYLRRDPSSRHAPHPEKQGRIAPAHRTYVDSDDVAAVFGAAQDELAKVVNFARQHHLKVLEQSLAKRLVRVSGSAEAMNSAFGVTLNRYDSPDGPYRSHEGEVHLPADLAGIVEGVLGLNNRKMVRGRPHPTSHTGGEGEGSPPAEAAPPNTYTPPTLAGLFDFPAADGTGQSIAVFAFNGEEPGGQISPGGYDLATLEQYFTSTLGQKAPNITDVVVQGPGNQPGPGESKYDSTGEVLLDLCVVGSLVPAADIVMYFTEFTEEGWVNAIRAAVNDTANKPGVISISYGNPEDGESTWSKKAIELVNSTLEQAATQGITVCCASGDTGSGDEGGGETTHVDFPASSPWVLGCGGIRLEVDAATNKITDEQVWNDESGASGGGVSRVFSPAPSWQQNTKVPDNADGRSGPGRGVPDVAGLADLETGVLVLNPGGSVQPVGGTSAAAPLWAALIVRLNQLTGTRLGFFNPVLYEHLSTLLVDIVTGNNGSYEAGPGWDPCTGWGRPDGERLLAALHLAGPPIPPPHTTPAKPSAPQERLFADPAPGKDENAFQENNTSEAYYESAYYKEHEEQLQQVPAPRERPPRLSVAAVLSEAALASVQQARKISFHAVGDTGPSKSSHIDDVAGVADAMVAARQAAAPADTPAFLFHLGDVIYNFGEPQYYYDQFYEPFRAYDAPIFAIPGNHDGFPEENQATLFAFLRNFCTTTPGPSPDSGGIMRSTMNQPGVYFTLEAPFVSIIGLYSNVLEGPGVISSEEGKYPITDAQLEFLTAELMRLKQAREANERAVILAVHHPPLSIDKTHGGTRGLAEDIDKACGRAGLRPDAILSGHAHLYQRYTRTVEGAEIPYIVAGSGGHGLTPAREAGAGPPTGYTITVPPLMQYGYLTVTVDMTGQAPALSVSFNATSGKTGVRDSVSVNLATRKIIAGT